MNTIYLIVKQLCYMMDEYAIAMLIVYIIIALEIIAVIFCIKGIIKQNKTMRSLNM